MSTAGGKGPHTHSASAEGSTAGPRLVHSIDVAAGPGEVWRAICDPAFTEQYFFALSVRSDWRPGAAIVYETPQGEPFMAGSILEYAAGRRLSYSVRVLTAELEEDLPSRITWELEATGNGCRLTVVHDEFEEESGTYRTVARGWPKALAGLKQVLESGTAREAQTLWIEDAKARLRTLEASPRGPRSEEEA